MSHHARCCCECEGDDCTHCSESSFSPDCWRVTFVGVTACDCSNTGYCDPGAEDLSFTGLGAVLNTTHDLDQGVSPCQWLEVTSAGTTLLQHDSTDGSCSETIITTTTNKAIKISLTKTSSTQFRLRAFDYISPIFEFFDDTITVDANVCEGELEFANDFTSCPDYDCGGSQQMAQDGTATARRCCT